MKRSNVIKKAGAIILNKDFNSVALVFRPQKNDWTFPKGHIEKEEDSVEASHREVYEETGIKAIDLFELPNMIYVDDSGNNVCVEMRLMYHLGDKEVKNKSEELFWVKFEDVSDYLSYENLKTYYKDILACIKKVCSRSVEVLIIVSKKENFISGAKLIIDELNFAGLKNKIEFIEDIDINECKNKDNFCGKVLYFLTNAVDISKYSIFFNECGSVVINNRFIASEEKLKLYLQHKISKNGVSVPKNYKELDDKDELFKIALKYPLYVKSQKQASSVMRAMNENDLLKIIPLFDQKCEKWYLEEAIEGHGLVLNKVYFVNGKYVVEGGVPKVNMHFLELIADSLFMDVFSADVIFSMSGEYWVIDVNPAAAFFKSHVARSLFIEFIIQKALQLSNPIKDII